jgi:hypothetical protein
VTQRCRRRHAPERSRFRARSAYPLVGHRTPAPVPSPRATGDPALDELRDSFAALAATVRIIPYGRRASAIVAAGRRRVRRRRVQLVVFLVAATPVAAVAGLWCGFGLGE